MREYLAYIAETKANLKEELLRSLEFCDLKSQVKTEDTVFVKPDFTGYHYEMPDMVHIVARIYMYMLVSRKIGYIK